MKERTMIMNTHFLIAMGLVVIIGNHSQSQEVQVSVDAAAGIKQVSPYLYGRNNSLSDRSDKPLTEVDWQLLRDAGVRMFRESSGNNSTKHNWRKKISSHPDWFNNVYDHDWDYEAQSLQDNIPSAQGLWSFQLIGKVAGNKSHNWDDWNYKKNYGFYPDREFNLAGGGQVDNQGSLLTVGDGALYTIDWPADSTTGILDHWFGANGLGLDPNGILYWNMDNEPEVWNSKHDDVLSGAMDVESYLANYFAVAKAARTKMSQIKLVGPVATNEWQWYNWQTGVIKVGNESYVWLEYFIKRVAEEQQASGVRLLDVLDIHFYPTDTEPADIMQLHRVYFDVNYTYPKANGVKRINGGWDNSITKEYIFKRCEDWLEQYMGAGHGVTFAVSETGLDVTDANLCALNYASTLGAFMDHGVEIFTPWTWEEGMWEVLHLYSRYNHAYRVESTSSQGEYISAYATMSETQDSLTVVLVNRHLTANRAVQMTLENMVVPDGSYTMLQLHNLPANETFVSHQQNALVASALEITNNSFSVTLPPLSVSSVQVNGITGNNIPLTATTGRLKQLGIFPNPTGGQVRLRGALPTDYTVCVTDLYGRVVISQKNNERLYLDHLAQGVYLVKVNSGNEEKVLRIVKQ